MNKAQRLGIIKNMKDKGFTLSGWCRANGFSLRTVQDFIYYGTGTKRGGNVTDRITRAMKRYDFIKSEDASTKA